MRTIRRLVLAVGAALVAAAPAAADDNLQLEARVWLDRGHDPVLHRGDRVRLYYRTTRDAYVSIFRLDTNGTTRLVYPRSPHDNHFVRSGRDYRLVFPQSSYWFVDDDPGVGYYFAIASETPFQFGAFSYAANTGYGWDLGHIYRNVYHDPYVAMDDLVAALVPDWRYSPYALDFATYHIGARYDYPRFLCYDCHGFRSFGSWNPYLASCTSFRVVIYNDPFFYPAFRYQGRRVVWARPPVYRQPRFIFKERAYGEAYQPIRTARPAIPVVSSTVPPPPVGRGADNRVRRAVPQTQAPTRQGQPLRAPNSAPERRAQPSILPPARPSGEVGQGRTAAPGQATVPDRATARPTAPNTRRSPGATTTAPGRGAERPTRPTQVLPGRENPGDIELRRRAGPAGGAVRPPATARPGQAAPSRTPPPRASAPSRSAAPRTAPSRSGARATTPRATPSRVTPPRTGTSRATPPRTGPSRTTPPRTGRTARPTRPPPRPPGGGGGPF